MLTYITAFSFRPLCRMWGGGWKASVPLAARFFHFLSVVSGQRSDAASCALSSGGGRVKCKPYSSAPSASLPLSVIIPPNGYPK